eukprot:scaffold96093_cov38-Phaeocystis_antarctica.AAC.1
MPCGSHTAAHKLAQGSIAARASNWRSSKASKHHSKACLKGGRGEAVARVAAVNVNPHPKMTDETRDRASSPEIIATSPYAPADGMARKTTHERYLGRRRSSQSEEMTTNGASPRR